MSRSAARFTQADIARALRAFEQVNGEPATIEFLPDGTTRIVAAGLKRPVQDDEKSAYDEWKEGSSNTLHRQGKTGAGRYPIPDAPDDPLAEYYKKIGFDPKTMNKADMQRLMDVAEAKWRASIPGMPLNVRERKVLCQFRDYGVGVLVSHDKLKGIGCETGERLNARGFVEIRFRTKSPDRLEGYILTNAGLAAAQKLS